MRRTPCARLGTSMSWAAGKKLAIARASAGGVRRSSRPESTRTGTAGGPGAPVTARAGDVCGQPTQDQPGAISPRACIVSGRAASRGSALIARTIEAWRCAGLWPRRHGSRMSVQFVGTQIDGFSMRFV